jgi:hypothetical protein
MGALGQTVAVASPQEGLWERYVRPLHPDQSNPGWHVSPVIDIAAYHFSWAWVLIPMLLAAQDRTVIYIYAVVMGANLAHRHYGLPYAYLDDGVFQAYRKQLTWFPQICFLLLAATPLLLSFKGTGAIAGQAVAGAVFFSLLWNFWHTYMQKFGILRLYRAKDPASVQLKTPAWVDKYFLLCWVPLYFSYLGPKYKDLILANGSHVAGAVTVIVWFMQKYERCLVLPSLLIAAGGVALWVWHEWSVQRFRNHARLSAAAGTLLISTAFFWANPVKVFIAFAFSHAVEYMVFVWAFQRRFYYRPRPVPPLMQRLLSHPKTWYLSFTAIFAIVGTAEILISNGVITGLPSISFGGMTLAAWFFYYAVYESLVHFYMDGFLWKMRRPEVRQNI